MQQCSYKLLITDINNDGLTFLSQSSYIKRQSLGANIDPIMNILTSNIYLNLRTYDEEALVLYANDNLNNFVQLHIDAGNNVTFMWNDGHFIGKNAIIIVANTKRNEQINTHQFGIENNLRISSTLLCTFQFLVRFQKKFLCIRSV